MARRAPTPRPARLLLTATVAALALAAASCGPSTAGGARATGSPGPTAKPLALPTGTPSPPLARVALIVLENHEFPAIIHNACCPYLNALAKRGSLFTNYTAITHPSLPNYLALTSGSPQGKTGTDNTSPIVDAPNLFAQLSANGIGWRAYEQTMPWPCYHGAFAGSSPGYYAKKHDPAMMFRNVATTHLCRAVVPWRGVPAAPPRFSMIVPNLCNDMHSCPAHVADAWLQHMVPALLAKLGSSGRVVITWDEGSTNTGGGGRVATILVGPGVPVGRVATRLNHYSLLAALESLFHLKLLGAARTAQSLPLFVP